MSYPDWMIWSITPAAAAAVRWNWSDISVKTVITGSADAVIIVPEFFPVRQFPASVKRRSGSLCVELNYWVAESVSANSVRSLPAAGVHRSLPVTGTATAASVLCVIWKVPELKNCCGIWKIQAGWKELSAAVTCVSGFQLPAERNLPLKNKKIRPGATPDVVNPPSHKCYGGQGGETSAKRSWAV